MEIGAIDGLFSLLGKFSPCCSRKTCFFNNFDTKLSPGPHAAPPQERLQHPMAAPLRNSLTSHAGRTCSCSCFRSWPGASVRGIASFGPANAPAQSSLTEGLSERLQPDDDALLLLQEKVASTPRESLSRTYFESSGAVWMGGRETPPDPNKAKLGKSKLERNTQFLFLFPKKQKQNHYEESFKLIGTQSSSANPPRTSSNPPPISPPARHPRPQHLAPAISLDASSPPRRLRPSRLQRRPLDLPHRMEPRAHHRQREARDPRRAHDVRASDFPAQTSRRHFRTARRALVREAESQRRQGEEVWWKLVALAEAGEGG